MVTKKFKTKKGLSCGLQMIYNHYQKKFNKEFGDLEFAELRENYIHARYNYNHLNNTVDQLYEALYTGRVLSAGVSIGALLSLAYCYSMFDYLSVRDVMPAFKVCMLGAVGSLTCLASQEALHFGVDCSGVKSLVWNDMARSKATEEKATAQSEPAPQITESVMEK